MTHMNARLSCFSFFLVYQLAFCSGPLHAQEATDTFKACAICHGSQGEGSEEVGAPAISGFEASYLARQINAFQKGWRGSDANDMPGQQMMVASKIIQSETELKVLTEYISNLAPTESSQNTGSENVANESADPTQEIGKSIYQGICASCHGNQAQGNIALNSPRLNHLTERYLKKQFIAFREGKRGAHKDDLYGRQMALMAKTVTDDTQLDHLVSFIVTLNNP